MHEPITCTHPDRPTYCRSACKQCYYNDRNRRKRSDPAYVAREREASKQYHQRADVKERYKAHFRRYYAADPERYRERSRCAREAQDKAQLRAYDLAYQRANRDRLAAIQHRRRARKQSNGVCSVTEQDVARLRARFRGRCAYCGRSATGLDHVIPIARGGRHSIGNLLPCCRPCNSSKNRRLLIEWRRRPRALAG